MNKGLPEGTQSIILFDGLCVLCSYWARFVLRNDRRGRFRMAAMQTPVGRVLAVRSGVDPDDPQTMLVVEDAHAFRDSDAILRILAGLGQPWRALGALRVVPRPLRDGTYRLVARNRHRLFGRRRICELPSPADASRFM